MRIRTVLTVLSTAVAVAIAGGAGYSPAVTPARAGADAESGVARFVRATGDGTLPTTAGGPEAKAYAFLADYGGLFGGQAGADRFRFGTDYCNGTDVGWYVDDVEIYECTAPAVTAAKS